MSESYFELTPEEHRELYEGVQGRQLWSDKLLEKDVWVCWTLNALFNLEDAPGFAFKGGTSLSKVYDVIHRFSEDIDITIDPNHKDLLSGFDPLDEHEGKKKLKKQGEKVTKKILPGYIDDLLKPQLERIAGELPERYRPQLVYTKEAPDALEIYYPSSLPEDKKLNYIRERVLVEFGARATTEPSHTRQVNTYLQSLPELKEVIFPTATVQVLSAERTFWEKATLIHYQNTRNDGPQLRERYARHWYDLYQLDYDPIIGPSARTDFEARNLVIRLKSIHFRGKGVDYERCRLGELRLMPESNYHSKLEKDFEEMRKAGMFVKEPPPFEDILVALAALEVALNDQCLSALNQNQTSGTKGKS